MAGGVADSELLDLIAATLPWFEKLAFGAPQKYTNYPILNRVLNEGMVLGGGKWAEFPVVIKPSGQAEFTQMYATKQYNQVDTIKKAVAPWARLTTHWLWDRRETLENRDAQQIVDIMKTRRIASQSDMANKFEEACWQTILTEASEFGSFRGVPYWISIGTTGGYNGVHTHDRAGTAINTVGGIDGSVEGQEYWANYTQTYTNKVDDLVAGTVAETFIDDVNSMLAGMATTYIMTNFRAPRTVEDLQAHNPLGNFRIYLDSKTNIVYDMCVRRHNIGQAFGYDMGKFFGQTAFNSTPIERVPQLDSLAAAAITGVHPIYFINHNEFKTMVLRGDEFYEHSPIILPDSGGNVAAINVDLSCQLLCKDRRSQGLCYTS
jgi:hypothetical protein